MKIYNDNGIVSFPKMETLWLNLDSKIGFRKWERETIWFEDFLLR